MVHHRVVAVTFMLGSVLVGPIRAAQPQPRVKVVASMQRNSLVRLDLLNMSPVPPAILMDAESEATSVYRAAGVTLVWSDGDSGTERPVRNAVAIADRAASSEPAVDLRVIVVAGQAERRFIADGRFADTVLGFAPMKANCFCGRSAYVFSERIMAVGYRRGNPTSLLGRVIAHEVGHLLLSSNSHSRVGIMRATLDTEPSFQPRFTPEQVRALGRGLARMQANQMASGAQRKQTP